MRLSSWKDDARFHLELFEFGVDGAGLALIFLTLLFTAGSVGFFFEIQGLAVERAHAVNGFVDALNQPLAFVVGESQLPHRQ